MTPINFYPMKVNDSRKSKSEGHVGILYEYIVSIMGKPRHNSYTQRPTQTYYATLTFKVQFKI